MHACVLKHKDGESWSRGGDCLTYGKEKTGTQTTRTLRKHVYAFHVVIGVYYQRGGNSIDEHQELPGQPM